MTVQCNCGGQPRLAYVGDRFVVSCTTGCGVRGPWRRSVDGAWEAWAWMQARLGSFSNGETGTSVWATVAAWAGVNPDLFGDEARPEQASWVWFDGSERMPALHDVIKEQGLLGEFCQHLTELMPEDRGEYRYYDAIVASPAQRTQALTNLIRSLGQVGVEDTERKEDRELQIRR